MPRDEFIGWIIPLVVDRHRQREGVRDILTTMHKPPLSGVDFQDPDPFVGGEERFDGVAFRYDPCIWVGGGGMPRSLGEGSFADHGVAVFVGVAISVAEVGPRFDFCD